MDRQNTVAVTLGAIPVDVLSATENQVIASLPPGLINSAFGLGYDDRHITSLDADRVVLAAIQGLHHLLREKEAELAALKELREAQQRAIAALETRLIALEASIGSTASR